MIEKVLTYDYGDNNSEILQLLHPGHLTKTAEYSDELNGFIESLKGNDDKSYALVNALGAGEYFGEMAILGKKRRNATIKTLEPTNLIAIREKDFHTLITHSEELKNLFKQKEEKRNIHLKEKGFND